MIYVTKTFLPSQEEFQKILARAWNSGWITNRGVLVEELENDLSAYLKVDRILAMTNGTLPLHVAIKALDITGEIITTPFSYVATVSSIVWEKCAPVFVDIHPEYLTIDETKIETAITDRTSAILATHVFGNPCHVEAIEAIAKQYNLKVIYDAAHCFGVTYNKQSIFNYGDVSTCSFHATKLFHTGEGGALFCKAELYDKMFYYHNFGHNGQEAFHGLGTNAKMSELQAALGLSILPYMDFILEKRKVICEIYDTQLKSLPIQKLRIREGTVWNYSYYPVIFDSELQLRSVQNVLNSKNIYPRRYFYPNLENLPYVESQDCNVAENISKRILCLPLYDSLENSSLNNIINIIKSCL